MDYQAVAAIEQGASVEPDAWYSIIFLTALIVLGGALGGVVNALGEGGLRTAHKRRLTGGGSIWIPGWQGNVFVGMVAALVMWGLHSDIFYISDSQQLIRHIAGAILAGAGGGRVITDLVDKRLLSVTQTNLTDSLETALATRQTGRSSQVKQQSTTDEHT